MISGCKWSQTHRAWYVQERKTIISELYECLNGKACLNYRDLKEKPLCDPVLRIKNPQVELPLSENKSTQVELSEKALLKLQEFKQWMRSKRYSENTVGTYTDALKIFLRYYSDKEIHEITNGDIIAFNNDYIISNKLSSSFQNQIVNAIKLFFSTIENKRLNPELIHRPKRQKLLPNVLSKEEVKLILEAHGNIKHKAMLSLIYSCGLRRGELLNLKLNDIDSGRRLVIIRQGKGRKDRIAPLSEKILNLLTLSTGSVQYPRTLMLKDLKIIGYQTATSLNKNISTEQNKFTFTKSELNYDGEIHSQKLIIYDLLGKTILDKNLEKTNSFDLKSGIYLIRVVEKDKLLYSQKICLDN